MRVRVDSGDHEGEEIPVRDEPLVIGRDSGCDLILPDPEVSRRHAVLRPLPDGRVEIENISSKNGTFIEGERIETPRVLSGDEQIRIGSTILRTASDRGTAAARPVGPATVQRMIAGVLSQDKAAHRHWNRRMTLMRFIAGATGSMTIAILWHLFVR